MKATSRREPRSATALRDRCCKGEQRSSRGVHGPRGDPQRIRTTVGGVVCADVRVLIAGDTYPPDVNGAARFTERLARGMVSRGHEVCVIAPSFDGRPTSLRDAGVDVRRVSSIAVPVRPRFWVASPLRVSRSVSRIIDDFVPDVVHVQSHFGIGRTAARLARARGCATVATTHFMPGNLMHYIPFGGSRLLRRAVAEAAWRDLFSVFRRADLVTAPTPWAARNLERTTGLSTVRPISCGVELPPRERAGRLRSRGAELSLLFVGRLEPEKRVCDLIEAIALLWPAVPVTLRVVGDGSLRRKLECQAADLGLAHAVEFLGSVCDDELASEYMRCDLFCMPSEVELQSIATLEAMAYSRPVLVADSMALPHLVAPGVNGLLFTTRDPTSLAGAIATAAGSRELLEHMGGASRLFAESHANAAMLESFENAYLEVCGYVAG